MNELDTYSTEDDNLEMLVAYLDGELDAETARHVELRLAEDAQYRSELQRLQQTWDLLDNLPRAEVDETFTHTTVEMIAVSAENALGDLRIHERRRGWWAWSLVGTGLLITSVASYLIAGHIFARPTEQLIADFDVIDNIELYRVADSVEFLQRLDEEGLFGEEVEDGL